MALERVEIFHKGYSLTPDEIVEGLQRPGVVDYVVSTIGVTDSRIRKLTLWIDPQVRTEVEAEIAELVQAVNDTYEEDIKHQSDEARYAHQKKSICSIPGYHLPHPTNPDCPGRPDPEWKDKD